MSDLNINNITDRTGGTGPVIAGVSTVSTTGAFTVPVGPTEYRGGRGRGIFAMGNASPAGVVNTMEKIEIATTGNATDFGDTTQIRMQTQGLGNATRGVFGGGLVPPNSVNTIDYTTISSGGGASDFGNLTTIRRTFVNGSSSNQVIGLFGAGYVDAGVNTNTIDFITFATTGDASDFGDLWDGYESQRDAGACASPTRAVWAGGIGQDPGAIASSDMFYNNFASKGNALQFATLTVNRFGLAGVSSPTRGVFGGGGGSGPSYTNTNTIDFITILTGGESTDFGDLSVVRRDAFSASNSVRGVFAGGYTPTHQDVIDFITVSTLGNAQDFGDMTQPNRTGASTSDSHGGIG